MTDASQFIGRSAVVTGGSRGIGLATAIALRSAGADVLICGRSADALEAAAAQIASVPAVAGRLVTQTADVREPEQAERLIASAVEQLGGVEILINNAGVGRFSPLAELEVDDWREMIETNLSGVFHCCRAAIPAMKQRGGGWIINVSSLAGKHPFAGGTAYCASKAGLNALTESLMQEVRRDGIRVSCVLPGSVDTRFAGNESSADAGWKLAASDVAQTVFDLLCHPPRSLPSRVEIRPSVPRK
ncbi:MAG: SDR family oxidoreductase [Vicinamibacterales bacterium]|nr:SDR family oxidoreductase [Vicinamibacterales bacterium]